MLHYFGDNIGNLVIPEDKLFIIELGLSFILSKIDTKFRFCDKIIDVSLIYYELISFLTEKRYAVY